MKKYVTAFTLNLQQEMQRRASLIMERIRSLALVLSLYFLWSSLLGDSSRSFLGYSRSQMMTYVLGMAFLRALILTSRALELTYEIARGRISAQLMRPMSLFGYQLSLDLSDKAVRVVSALIEIGVLTLLLDVNLYVAQSGAAWIGTCLAVILALVLYYFISLAISSAGFWTAESIGFLWAASLFMEFCSGAFFPLDVLPESVARVLKASPFPYLIYFPINVYLERLGPGDILGGLALQVFWIVVFYVFARLLWRAGLANYQAEGG